MSNVLEEKNTKENIRQNEKEKELKIRLNRIKEMERKEEQHQKMDKHNNEKNE